MRRTRGRPSASLQADRSGVGALPCRRFGLPPAHYDRYPELRAGFHMLSTSKDRWVGGAWAAAASRTTPLSLRGQGRVAGTPTAL